MLELSSDFAKSFVDKVKLSNSYYFKPLRRKLSSRRRNTLEFPQYGLLNMGYSVTTSVPLVIISVFFT
jgi:hypothetical protein